MRLIIALLAIASLAACSTATVSIQLPDGSQAEGDADAIAMIYTAQLESQRLERQAQEARDRCDGDALSEAGEVACFHAATITAIVGSRTPQASLLASYQERKARETEAKWRFAGQALSTASTLGLGYIIGQAVEAGFDAAQGDSTSVSNYVELDDESSFNGDFASTGVGHQAVGGATQTIGSAQGGSALDTNDTLTTPNIDASGGDGEAAGSGAPITTNPTDVDSDTSLF